VKEAKLKWNCPSSVAVLFLNYVCIASTYTSGRMELLCHEFHSRFNALRASNMRLWITQTTPCRAYWQYHSSASSCPLRRNVLGSLMEQSYFDSWYVFLKHAL
jgi:hypothetical protein